MIDVSMYKYDSPLVPKELDGLTIVHISDFHNQHLPGGPEPLVSTIRSQSPDIIAITGDLIDRHHPDISTAIYFIRLISEIAPVYFTPGNHEFRSGQYASLLPRLKTEGVHILDDTSETLSKNGVCFSIAGLRDPAFFTSSSGRTDKETLSSREAALRRLINSKGFTILLSHRPEFFKMYKRNSVSLVLCGHAHGGQVRLPLIGGLYSPGQGIFPKYTSGVYKDGNTAMIVSRGLVDKFLPPRIFNSPEIVVIKLMHKYS